MKMLNRTTISDDIVRAVLVRAGRAVGAKTGRVVVEVNQGRSLGRCSGLAMECMMIRVRSRRGKWGWMSTDCGSFKIVMPAVRWSPDGDDWGDPLRAAEAFFRIARHEWAHVRENQHGGAWAFEFSGRDGGRRPPWADRPEELRAEAACDDADALGRSEEWAYGEIMALGIALEEKVIAAREEART